MDAEVDQQVSEDNECNGNPEFCARDIQACDPQRLRESATAEATSGRRRRRCRSDVRRWPPRCRTRSTPHSSSRRCVSRRSTFRQLGNAGRKLAFQRFAGRLGGFGVLPMCLSRKCLGPAACLGKGLLISRDSGIRLSLEALGLGEVAIDPPLAHLEDRPQPAAGRPSP